MRRREEDDRLVRLRIGDNIARRRAELDITRAECARRAEVSVSEIAALEAGDRQPLAGTLKKVAAALGWELSDVFDGTRWVMPSGPTDEGHFEIDRRRRWSR